MKLFIATPMFGAQCAGIYADSMIRLYDGCARSNIQLQHRFYYNSSLITAARTKLANEFMAGDADYLMFIDADTGFNPQYVIDLIVLQQQTRYDVIGASYLKKNIHWDKVMAATKTVSDPNELNYHTGEYAVKYINEGNAHAGIPVEVEYLGTGFMLIPRSTFEMFRQAYAEYAYANKTKVLYFQAEIRDDVYISEDVFFCKMIRQAGGHIGCCPWMKIAHFGNHVYGGPPTEFVG